MHLLDVGVPFLFRAIALHFLILTSHPLNIPPSIPFLWVHIGIILLFGFWLLMLCVLFILETVNLVLSLFWWQLPILEVR